MKKYEFTKEQQQIYLMDKFGDASIAGISASILLRGKCSEAMLLYSANELIKRCDIFHIRVHDSDGELYQEFVQPDDYMMNIMKFHHKEDLNSWAEADAKTAIGLSGRLFEIYGVVTEYHFGIYIKMHHIICDAWTLDLVAETFAEICKNCLNIGNMDLKQYSFEDYLKNFTPDETKQEKGRKFWEKRLSECTNCVTLAYKDGHKQTSERIVHNISETSWYPVIDFCDDNGFSPYVVSLAALGILMSVMAREDNFYIGTTLYNRTGEVEKNTMGMFVDTSAVFLNFDTNMTALEAVEAAYESAMDTMKNSKFVYADILAIMSEKYKNNNRLYEVSLNYQINHLNDRTDIKTEWYHCGSQTDSLDIHMREIGDGIKIYYDYHVEKFDREEINNIHRHFIQIINEIVEHPDRKISEIDLISKDEEDIILNQFNDTWTQYPSDRSMSELFDEQVRLHPENVAVACDGVELTYEQLNEKANAVAKCLVEHGVKGDDHVAVLSDKCLEMLVAIVGIIKAGGAYVPISPSYPNERIQFILEDSKPKVILTNKTEVETHFTKIDYNDIVSNEIGVSNIVCGKPDDCAYIIYTSGTTGKPKGVIIEHRNVVRLVKNTNYITLDENSVILQTGDISFDASTFEIWGALLNGGKVILAKKDILMAPRKLKKTIRQQKINIMFITTALFNQLIEFDSAIFDSLKYLLFGGEKTSEEFVRFFLENENNKNVRLFNVYGPTEATTFSSYYEIKRGTKNKKTPIGKPIANSTCYIMNGRKLCGVGMAGELCLGGDGVGRGYLNRPELSTDKFIKNPFGEGNLYRSGDLARWLEDGNIEYLGRIDEQVKIRGFRIELGEIESVIRGIYGIKDATVIVREDKGEKFICAYVVADVEINLSDLKAFLQENMPNYMIPSYLMQIDAIPFTSNGKVDKKALPRIEMQSGAEFVPPRNRTEKAICDIFSKILGIEKISIKDSFFDLGGHSLRAIKLTNSIEAELNVHIEISEVFANTTVERLAGLVALREGDKYESIPVADKKAEYLMSSIQRRIYYVCQLDQNSITYNIPQTILFEGDVQPERIRNTLQTIIDRHEILRTEFILKDGELIQRIRDFVEADFEYIEDSDTTEEQLERDFVRPFDLSRAPLVRIKLVKRADHKFIMLTDIHHIVSDGMSQVNFIHEFSRLYNGEELKPVTRQYKDYSEWMQRRDLSAQRDYWVSRFSDDVPVLDMPLDYPRPKEQKFSGDTIVTMLSADMNERIQSFVYRKGITTNMLYLSALMIVLGKYSRQEDVTIGIPISGRTHKDTEEMLGMFVNTLVMRGKPERDKKIESFLDEIKEICLNAYGNQEFPFEELVDSIKLKNDMSRNPLFDVMLAVQNNEQVQYELNGIKAEELTQQNTISKFDLTFDIVDKEDGIRIALEYSTSIFTKQTAEHILCHFEQVIMQIVEKDIQKISDIEMITFEEKQRILGEFNASEFSYDEGKLIIQHLEEQAANHPEAIALVYKDKEMSYGEFNEKVNVLAHKLREDGIRANDFVAVVAERSMEMILAIFAVLKAGAAYVPIDPSYPSDRVNYIFRDCMPKAILTYNMNVFSTIPLFELSDETVWEGDTSNPEFINRPEDFVYCIYTSGTTGNPKGVLNMHKGLLNIVHWMQRKYPLSPQDAIMQKTTFVFDVSASEIFWWCLIGARLVILEAGGEMDPVIIANEIERSNVSMIDFVPSMLTVFLGMAEKDNELARKLLPLKYVFAAGEALNAESVNQFYRLMTLIQSETLLSNLYGPTEASIYSSWYDCHMGMDSVPIGKPIGNAQLYVMDGMQLCGVGVPGELCIAGTGVSSGYLNRDELTEEKFIKNQYGKGKMYRTGDLVRWLPDGNIAYMGRIDKQIKIRGFRIELGEIESVIRKLKYVKDCAVISRERDKEAYLNAYIVSDESIDINRIKGNLRRHLPEYMVPSHFMQVAEIPVTRNGKLDRSLLPEIDVDNERQFVEPGTLEEISLCNIFGEILGVSKISMTDNFFELGGDSIKAIRIVSKMREAGYDITVKTIMNGHTLDNIAMGILSSSGQGYEQGEVTGEFLPTPVMNHFLHWKLSRPEHFNQAMIFPVAGNVTVDMADKALKAIFIHHDALRLVVSDRRFFLRGSNEIEMPKAEVLDFTGRDHVRELSEVECTRLQSSMELDKGPLMKAAYIKTDNNNYVLICLHHLVVDGVSWRIIKEDFYNGINSVVNNEKIVLPKKTASYIDWSDALRKYVRSYQFSREKSYWMNEMKYPVEEFAQKTFTGQSGYCERRKDLSEDITDKLIHEAGSAYNTEINDLLVSALAMAVGAVGGQTKITVVLEGHGREELDEPIAIDRTVGWFTAMYPVTLECFRDVRDAILNTKDRLHKIPNHGIGYGLIEGAWNYMTADIYFNYHGKIVSDDMADAGREISSGKSADDANRMPGSVNINGMIEKGRLVFSVIYDRGLYEERIIDAFLSEYQTQLERVVEHCVGTEQSVQTASDFTADDLSMEDFDIIEDLL